MPRRHRSGTLRRSAAATTALAAVAGAVALAMPAAVAATGTTGSSTPVVQASADFTHRLITLPPYAVSTNVSTYGLPITTDTTARAVYQRIARGQLVKVPLLWNGGNPISSAQGGNTAVSGDAWVAAIRAMGAKVMIQMGGLTTANFSPDQAAGFARRYHPYAIMIGNEFEISHMTVQDYVSKIYLPGAEAIRAVDPNILIGGPSAAWYDVASLQYFVDNTVGYCDILDYHHYGEGDYYKSSALLMRQTGIYESGLDQLRQMLQQAGAKNVQLQLGEFNLSYRFRDGATDFLGGDGRFYRAFNTAWATSVFGHILRAGARGVAWAQQNGALGIMVQPGFYDAGKPDGTTMPIYHAIGAFQGEGLHRGFGTAVMATSSSGPLVEVYAGSSGNVVIVDKAPSARTVHLRMTGVADGRVPVWLTRKWHPYDPPVRTTARVLHGALTLTLQGYQVATVIATRS